MNMPAVTQDLTTISSTNLILQGDSFNRIMQLAEVMAKGGPSIPEYMRGNVGDCAAVIMQAMQWNMNPWGVAQKTHSVKGVMGYEAQLVNAAIISIAPITGRPNYEWFGDWTKVTGKFTIKNGDKGEYRVPGWKLEDEEGLGVKVWATIKGESEPRVLTLLLAQARTRNSTLWADDPQQQIAYLGLKKWSRLHTPEVILGVYTKDELETIPEEREINPAPNHAEPAAISLPVMDQAKFLKNFPSYEAGILSGRKTHDQVIKVIQSKFTLTTEQEEAIRSVAAPINGEIEVVE